MFPQGQFTTVLISAKAIIHRVPGYHDVEREIDSRKILFDPRLSDRAYVTLLGNIKIGPEAVSGTPLSLAGTLVHEVHHLSQPLLYRTWSFWRGIFRREHPHKWLEWPAYRAQAQFLLEADAAHVPGGRLEALDVLESFLFHYGMPENLEADSGISDLMAHIARTKEN